MVQSVSSEGNGHSLGQEIMCLYNLKAHHCIHHLRLKVLTTAEELYEFHETSDQLCILDLNNSPPLNRTYSHVSTHQTHE
jgi:hypothetical protein